MERTIRIQTELNEEKYYLLEKYKDVGIYQEVTPNGYYVHQSYGFKINDKFFMSESYNHNNKKDLLDFIDNYKKKKIFGFRAFNKGSYYCIHPNGNLYL